MGIRRPHSHQPGFSDIFKKPMAALWGMIADGSMAAVYPTTLKPLGVGLVISSFLGVGCGIFMGLNEKAEWFRGAGLYRDAGSPAGGSGFLCLPLFTASGRLRK
jgi:hypothetical protein